MVRRAGKRPVDALAEEVLNATKDHRSMVDGVDVDARQGLRVLNPVRKFWFAPEIGRAHV